MAAKNIGQLLHALAQFETWHRLCGETVSGTLAWNSTLAKSVHWQHEAYGTPGIQKLVRICRASGRVFGYDWLAEQHAKLIEDCGLSQAQVDAMTAAEIVPHLRKLRNGKQLKPVGRRPGTTGKRRRDIESALLDNEHPNDVATRLRATPNYVNRIRRKLEADGKLIVAGKGTETRR